MPDRRLDARAVYTVDLHSFSHGNRGTKLATALLTSLERVEQRFELATGRDGSRQISNLSLQALKGGPEFVYVAANNAGHETRQHPIDDGHHNGRAQHVTGDGHESRFFVRPHTVSPR